MSILKRGVGPDRRWFYPASGTGLRFILAYLGIWSLFYPYLQNVYGLDTVAPLAAGASAVGVGVMVIGPPIAGTILDYLETPKIPFAIAAASFFVGMLLLASMFAIDSWAEAQWFYYAGSFLTGIGVGMTAGTAVPTLSRWYRGERMGRAMGIINMGDPLGRVALAPIVAGLIAYIGFGYDLFLLIGIVGAVVVVIVGVVLWRNPTQEEIDSGVLSASLDDEDDDGADNGEPDEAMSADAAPEGDSGAEDDGEESIDEEGVTIGEAVKMKEFWILYFAMMGAAFSYMGLLQNISTIMIEGLTIGGYSEAYVADWLVPTFLSLTGLLTAIGAYVWGDLMDRLGGPWRTLPFIYGIPAVLIGVFYFGYTNLYLVLGIGAVMFFFFGGEPAVHYAAVPHLFGRKNIGMVMSYINAFSVGTGIVLGPTVMAYINDLWGGYALALALAVALRLLSTGLSLYGLRVSKAKAK